MGTEACKPNGENHVHLPVKPPSQRETIIAWVTNYSDNIPFSLQDIASILGLNLQTVRNFYQEQRQFLEHVDVDSDGRTKLYLPSSEPAVLGAHRLSSPSTDSLPNRTGLNGRPVQNRARNNSKRSR